MKAILCGACSDIRALNRDNPVSCHCGKVQGWWVNSTLGVAKVYAEPHNRYYARIIGIHNIFLKTAFVENTPLTDAIWKEMTRWICDNSDGYLFNKDRRDCPIVIIAIGQSNDVTWSQTPYHIWKIEFDKFNKEKSEENINSGNKNEAH
jgi:hypothetical protein